MKQEELKLLAEWYGYKDRQITPYKDLHKYECYEIDHNGDVILVDGDFDTRWQPHKDSNQLDILEDKMLNDLRIKFNRPVSYTLGLSRKGDFYFNILRVGEFEDALYYAEIEGKTKNEARLNAILNYVKGLK